MLRVALGGLGVDVDAAQRTIRFTTFSLASPMASVWSSNSNSCHAGQPLTYKLARKRSG